MVEKTARKSGFFCVIIRFYVQVSRPVSVSVCACEPACECVSVYVSWHVSVLVCVCEPACECVSVCA